MILTRSIREAMATSLTEAEWAVVERLAECHSLLCELPGLDLDRFDAGIQALQEQVLSLPTKRALKHNTIDRTHDG